MAFPIGAAIGVGIGALGNFFAAQEEQANREAMRARLEEAMISDYEQAQMEQNLNRAYSSNIAQQANRMAFTTRGTDASIAQASMLGAAEGSRLNALAGLGQDIQRINTSIETQMAGIQDVNLLDATLVGATEGGMAGQQISTLLKYQDELTALEELRTADKDTTPDGSAAPLSNFPDSEFLLKDTPDILFGKNIITEDPLGFMNFGGF